MTALALLPTGAYLFALGVHFATLAFGAPPLDVPWLAVVLGAAAPAIVIASSRTSRDYRQAPRWFLGVAVAHLLYLAALLLPILAEIELARMIAGQVFALLLLVATVYKAWY
jgi:hypothetical protein